MAEVKAPYNFVPLNNKIVPAEWADYISHDIPFSDSVSGEIEIEIEAISPIFIGGNEIPIPDSEFKQKTFPEFEGKNYIPGSSLKGEIANVLEIITFSRLRYYNNYKFSQRDWNNSEIYKKLDFAKVKGGWLRKTQSGFQIRYNKKKPGRIEHRYISNEINNFFGADNGQYDANSDEHKSARFKYELAGLSNGNTFRFDPEFFEEIGRDNFGKVSYRRATETGKGEEGILVMTGQSSVRRDQPEKSGKRFEFIFWTDESQEKIISLPSTFLKGEEKFHKKINDFFMGQFDDNPNSYSPDWSFWKRAIGHGHEIPVFVTEQNGEIAHFGLSMLYKIPFLKSIEDVLPDSHKFRDNTDLTESIFGEIEKDKKKGRVHFGHLFADECRRYKATPIHLILGSPKASFYPFYIDQKISNSAGVVSGNYFTFNDGEISGRKRYPVRVANEPDLSSELQSPSRLTANINPLAAGSIFNGKVIFHNLKPTELGAVLSSMTFHGQENCFHTLGMAKPFGFGKSKLSIKKLIVNKKEEKLDSYLSAFEAYMSKYVSGWIKSEQLKELIAMATPTSSTKLKYLPLEDFKGLTDSKRGNQPIKGLPRFSIFTNKEVNLKPFIAATRVDTFAVPNQSGLNREVKIQVEDRIRHVASEIDRLIQEIESRERNKEIAEFQAKEAKRKEKVKEAAVEGGIQELNFEKCRDLSDVAKILKVWLSNAKLELVPIQEHDELFTILTQVVQGLNKKSFKGFVEKDYDRAKIISWVGEELGNQWYEKLKKAE